ncbi:hypothetical protein CROQUDRAFT_224393 [Cronartium quercuum f. sp. fusiforme G11]|uniref:Uncharacterized protein n=1 Tax=Cronartium quercuum f. sp. fusiforme G11 TaxID=708437 RepID=A0A9P6NBJ1_9BASI|nr:hypothetical protein CROQUDRAFT_224393 [Cronartium quercuum f. sp. fusiforme G11]
MISSASHAFLVWYFTNFLASQSSASLVPRQIPPSKEVTAQSSLVAMSNPTNTNVTTAETSFAPEPSSRWIQTGLPTSGLIRPPQTQPVTMNGNTTVTPTPPQGNARALNGKLEITQNQSVQNGGTSLISEKNAVATTGQSSISQTQTVNKPTVQWKQQYRPNGELDLPKSFRHNWWYTRNYQGLSK